LEANPQPVWADVAFDEDLADLRRPLPHLSSEQCAVMRDEFVRQLVWQCLIGVEGRPLLNQLLGHVSVVVLVRRIEEN
jgi:hypothetical protein